MSQEVGAHWSPWTPAADLDRAAPLFARISGQTAAQMATSLRHLEYLGLMQVRRGQDGQQQFRVRTDHAARALALLDDFGQSRRN